MGEVSGKLGIFSACFMLRRVEVELAVLVLWRCWCQERFLTKTRGQLRPELHREVAMRRLSIPQIWVRLNPDNRSLTLARLGGEENDGDWSFFGAPTLEREPGR